MSTYAVVLDDQPNGALDDLKDLPKAVRLALLDVMAVALSEHVDPQDDDEGELFDGWRWRAGVTREQRAELNQQEYEGAAGEHAYDFRIYYRSLSPAEVLAHGGQAGYFVANVWPSTHVAALVRDRAVRGGPLAP